MPAVTVRSLSDETHRALKVRAAQRGRSTEAEIRDILDAAVQPKARVKVGAALAAFGKRFGGVDLDFARDKTPTDAAKFT